MIGCYSYNCSILVLRENRGSHKKYNKTATIEKLDNKKASEDMSIVPKYCRHKNFSGNLDFYQNIDTEIESIIISSKYFVREKLIEKKIIFICRQEIEHKHSAR